MKTAPMSQPYLSLEAELHDVFWNAEDDATEVGLMAAFLEKHPGRALEIGCGSGRLLLPLVEAGMEIEGLELSPDMLRICRMDAEKRRLQPTLHEGDMSKWDSGRKYSAILAPAFTLQLAPDPEATLRHWHRMLQNHGGLYLTIFIPYAELLGDLPENQWYRDHEASLPDGRTALLETRHLLDRPGRFLRRSHRYSISGGEVPAHCSEQNLRWFEPGEWVAILERCGFHARPPFADFDPERIAENPDAMKFDGILTFHAIRVDR